MPPPRCIGPNGIRLRCASTAAKGRCSQASASRKTFTPAAAPARFKVGLMLPYSGTYAKLGEAIENGMRMAVA